MKYTIWIFWGLSFLLIHTQAWGQVKWQIGGIISITRSIPEQLTSDIAGVSSRNYFHPQYQMNMRLSLNKRLGLETGIGLQYHGTSLRYVPDFGIHKGNRHFLKEKGRVSMLAIPLLVSYDLKLDNRFLVRFATGAVWLLNPWLDSKISIDGQFDAGNDSLLYQRSESWVFPFSALNFMSKAEFIFPLKGRGELTMGFIYQQGFNQTLRQTRFSYSFFLPIYDQRIVWVNRGDMIGLSLGIMLPIRSKNARKSAH